MIVRERASTVDEISVASDDATRPDCPAPINREESCICLRLYPTKQQILGHNSEVVHGQSL